MNKHNLTLLPAIALSCIAGKLLAQQHQRPNILWIMSDDHSYQTISAYGSEVSKLNQTQDKQFCQVYLIDDTFSY